MTVLEAIGLACAAFAAGGINAVAGGGSLVSFPALLAAGYPAKAANVTNTVALWPGHVGGSLGYRDLLVPQRRTVVALSTSSILGAIAGSAILLATPESAFEAIVPFLILFAVLLLALQTRVAVFVATRRQPGAASGRVPVALHAAVFGLAVYGAYFGAGLGILTLAVLGDRCCRTTCNGRTPSKACFRSSSTRSPSSTSRRSGRSSGCPRLLWRRRRSPGGISACMSRDV